MTEPKTDWLDDATEPAKPMRTIDRVRAEKSRAVARTAKKEEFVALLRQLSWEQRTWLRALADNDFNVRKARAFLKGSKLPAPHTNAIAAWTNLAVFTQAREILAEMMYEANAPSKSGLLLRLNEIAEFNTEVVDELHQGAPTGGKKMRDVSAALKATELQGKSLKMFGEEHAKSGNEGPQLIVQVIMKDDPTRIVDVTPGRVQVERPVIEGESEPVDGEA